MGHLSTVGYRQLQQRMDRSVPGIFDSEALYRILSILFTEEDARLCSAMPLTYFGADRIADVWKVSRDQAVTHLQRLGDKGLVCSKKQGNETLYLLAPPVLGFFEFSLMRTDGRFDRKQLSELYHRYISVEEGFARQYASMDPPVARMFVQEDSIRDLTSEVLPYERASAGIDEARCITVGTCFCRHKMEHMGMGCDNPQDVCLTFNDVARHLADHGIAREIDTAEAHDILNRCVENGLVQIGDNRKDELIVICNCCGCCCDLLGIYKRFGETSLISPSAYIAQIDPGTCTECGICAERCPVDAIGPSDHGMQIDRERCLGCGVCARFCPIGTCTMAPRDVRPYVPESTFEKVALQSVHQAKLGNFLFDDARKRHHRYLAGAVNTTLRLPFVRSILLGRALRPWLLRLLRGQSRFRVSAGRHAAAKPERNP